jgi:hypothetical protein
MGEVYRARDTRLDRDVALKILPDVFAGDVDRLARFEREAKSLAALNHPHIAQIYGLEDIGKGVRALVMELVVPGDEGRLARGGEGAERERDGPQGAVSGETAGEQYVAARRIGSVDELPRPSTVRVPSRSTAIWPAFASTVTSM